MIFQTQGAIDKILRGEKTETRRIWKPVYISLIEDFESRAIASIVSVRSDGKHKIVRNQHTVYEVGKTYAVQPGRGKSTHMVETYDAKRGLIRYPLRIRILELWREDVREISDASLKAEGEYDHMGYMLTWCKMHDKPAYKELHDNEMWYGMHWFDRHPPERYDALAIRFEVVHV